MVSIVTKRNPDGTTTKTTFRDGKPVSSITTQRSSGNVTSISPNYRSERIKELEEKGIDRAIASQISLAESKGQKFAQITPEIARQVKRAGVTSPTFKQSDVANLSQDRFKPKTKYTFGTINGNFYRGLTRQELEKNKLNPNTRAVLDYSRTRLLTGKGTSRDLFNVLSRGKKTVDIINTASVARSLANINEEAQFYKKAIEFLNPDQKKFYNSLPKKEQKDYLLTVVNRRIQPKQEILSQTRSDYIRTLPKKDRIAYLKQRKGYAVQFTINRETGERKLIGYGGVTKIQAEKFIETLKRSDLEQLKKYYNVSTISAVTKEKGIKRIQQKLTQTKNLVLNKMNKTKSPVERQALALIVLGLVGAGRGIVNAVSAIINPITFIKDNLKALVRPKETVTSIVNTFIEDPAGTIAEFYTFGKTLKLSYRLVSQNPIGRTLLEEAYLNTKVPKNLRPSVRTLLKSNRAQEKIKGVNIKNIKNIKLKTKELSNIEVKWALDATRTTKGVLFGSGASRILTKGKSKLPSDLDIAVSSIDKFNKAFIENVPKKLRKNYIIKNQKIVRNGVKILDVKPLDRLIPDKIITGKLPISGVSKKIVLESDSFLPKLKKRTVEGALTVPTQKLIKIKGLKLVSLGEQTTRKILGTIQVLIEKNARRAKDPSSLLESLYIEKGILLDKLKTPSISKLLIKRRIKLIDNAINLLLSKDFQKILNENVPKLTKDYPLIAKINVKKLKNARLNTIKRSAKTKINTILKTKSINNKKSKITNAKITKLSSSQLSKLPTSKLPNIPLSIIPKLNPSQLSKLPTSKIPKITLSIIPKLSSSQLSKLPTSKLPNIPLSIIPKLSSSQLSKIPSSILPNIPPSIIPKLNPSQLSKLPTSKLPNIPLSIIPKLNPSQLSKLPKSKLPKIPLKKLSPKIKLTWDNKPPKNYSYLVNVRVRVKGKVKTIPLKTTPNRALNYIIKLVDNTTSRSFDLIIVGISKIKDIKKPSLKKFRLKISRGSKVLKFVEKSKYAIDTKGEKRGLRLKLKK